MTLQRKVTCFGDKIIPYYCKSCGYIELFKEIRAEKEEPKAEHRESSVLKSLDTSQFAEQNVERGICA